LTIQQLEKEASDSIILDVAYNLFKNMDAWNIRTFGKEFHIHYDLKNLLPTGAVELSL
jgi:hypothetical protein